MAHAINHTCHTDLANCKVLRIFSLLTIIGPICFDTFPSHAPQSCDETVKRKRRVRVSDRECRDMCKDAIG